ncbi:hypothetical protein [Bdellovibrio bacteriovorus]|uniref:hypothetical protein n=1 Tax=Bdellovibrio bacteriovorus TaxID=959 RepID=UPI0035A8E2F4
MKIIFATLLILISSIGLAQHHHHSDPASIHGMLLFGKSQIYLSHLPMFHSPHDYQVILKAELSTQGKNAYLESLKSSSETVYTLVPESFNLPEMIKHPHSFKAQIYKGHFERGGVLIAENVTVNIQVLYFKKFASSESKPLQGSYLLFGNKEEQFLAHLITTKPDFDQIVQVKAEETELLPITFKCVSNTEPLKSFETLEATASGKTLVIQTEESLYTEFGDLSF